MSYQGLTTWLETETYENLKTEAMDHVWFPFQQWDDIKEQDGPLILVEGNGVKLKDFEGKEYFDGFAGLALVNVGHGRTEIANAVYDQLTTMHYNNPFAYTSIPTIKLAKKVASLTPADLNKVFFTSGGSEAVETALKMARQYHYNRGEKQRTKFIARKGSYLGVSLGSQSVNSSTWTRREIFEPLIGDNVLFAPQPLPYRCGGTGKTPSECAISCANAVEEIMLREGPDTVAAVIAEPITASLGAVVPGPEYWPMLRDICDKYGVILIADEVINGFGRTGKMFAIEHFGVVPDIMTVAKGITSGYQPVGACIARDYIAEGFRGGKENTFGHGFTYGCHPAGGAAGLANIEIIERENLVENAATLGSYLLEKLAPLKEHPTVGDIRGKGLLCAIELVKDKQSKENLNTIPGVEKKLTQRLKNNGMLTRATTFLTVVPPLNVTKQDIDDMVDIVEDGISFIEKELNLT